MMPHAAGFACNSYSYTLSHGARDCLSHLAGMGFREVELMMYPGHLWPPETGTPERRQLRARIDALGLRVVTLNMPNVDLNIAGASAEMRRYTLDLLKGIVELAGELGVPGVVLGPGKANPLLAAPTERLIGHLFAALDELAPLAARAGTALWVENIPFAFLPEARRLTAVLDRDGNPDIGIVWDAANSHFVGEDLGQSLRLCAPRLKLVHLSDTGRALYRHDPVGQGTVPFAELAPLLAEVGHARLCVLEVISADADRDILASAERLAAMGLAHG
jgi:sugar phosphate isomerase/epimerase